MRVRVHDDLVLRNDGRHTCIALNDALVRRRLCALVVGAVALARCVNSARVPLRCLEAWLGSFTPSIANSSRPISPRPSHTASTPANTCAMSSRSVPTTWAIVVKCGADMPHNAMNVTCSWQTRSIARLRTMPCQYANSTTVSNMARNTPVRPWCHSRIAHRSTPDPPRGRVRDAARARTYRAGAGVRGPRSGTAGWYRVICSGPWRTLASETERRHIHCTQHPSSRSDFRFHLGSGRDLSYNLGR